MNETTGKLYGYIRVSTKEQNEEIYLHLDALASRWRFLCGVRFDNCLIALILRHVE